MRSFYLSARFIVTQIIQAIIISKQGRLEKPANHARTISASVPNWRGGLFLARKRFCSILPSSSGSRSPRHFCVRPPSPLWGENRRPHLLLALLLGRRTSILAAQRASTARRKALLAPTHVVVEPGKPPLKPSSSPPLSSLSPPSPLRRPPFSQHHRMYVHVDAHLSGAFQGEVPSSWLQVQGRPTCRPAARKVPPCLPC